VGGSSWAWVPTVRSTSRGPVLDRLAAEHRVIHGLLEAVDQALVSLVTDSTTLTPLTRALDRLSGRLRSHLLYEEEQLVGPLNRYGNGV
jgi:Hemerythrin HHE cation binding domain